MLQVQCDFQYVDTQRSGNPENLDTTVWLSLCADHAQRLGTSVRLSIC